MVLSSGKEIANGYSTNQAITFAVKDTANTIKDTKVFMASTQTGEPHCQGSMAFLTLIPCLALHTTAGSGQLQLSTSADRRYDGIKHAAAHY